MTQSKKIFVALLAALTLFSFSVPKKAEAGLLIGAMAGNAGVGAIVGAGVGLTMVGAACATYEEGFGKIVGCAFMNGPLLGGGDPMGGVFSILMFYPAVILDVKLENRGDLIQTVLEKAFPEIDDREAIASLTNLMKEKVRSEANASGQVGPMKVSATCTEVQAALESIALSGAEMAGICSALK